ncbi:hypothetical protein AB0C10_17245 [Microbispora amethystogenes]|uniref:hypothetical protein n=1 Tax=Microbispora amethystogenes TaxID=1427754 RepID=UPI0033CC4389
MTRALWAAVLWRPLDDYSSYGLADAPTASIVAAVGLFAILALKAWMLRQVFTLRAHPAPPADRRTVWLRRLLYVAVADALVLRLPAALLPDVLTEALTLALWCPLQVLFALVLTGGRLRAVALARSARELTGPGDAPAASGRALGGGEREQVP